MITYKNELLVTKEIISVLSKYTKIAILKQLLIDFSFEKDNVSKLLTKSNKKYGVMSNPSEHKDDAVWSFVSQFIDKLNADSKMALYICVLNSHYDHFEEEFLGTDISVGLDENNLDKELGRFLASKIYEPKDTELQNTIIEHLKGVLINFSTEFDFSLIDDDTIENINEVIEDYIMEGVNIFKI